MTVAPPDPDYPPVKPTHPQIPPADPAIEPGLPAPDPDVDPAGRPGGDPVPSDLPTR